MGESDESTTGGDEPAMDKALLKRALKAFKKRLKLTRLDAESTLGGRQLTGGRTSGITAIMPPDQYPKEIWKELARQGRLVDVGQGMFELPPEGP